GCFQFGPFRVEFLVPHLDFLGAFALEEQFRECFDPTPPGSKSVANWQTHFFSCLKSHFAMTLHRKLSLPTVANSLANWQTHFVASVVGPS
ncbi:MAG TPA: hypothetical protein VG099_24910, partial [Gemmataceae bacterium]|nr:hypothetical protein [Gemmataceae bacterium]